jgi:4-hydroxy-tetrahydrodipicolinate synthase
MSTNIIVFILNGNYYPFGMETILNKKKLEYACQQRHQLAEIMKLIFKEGSPSGVKALMEQMGTVKNQVRLPNVPVSAGTYAAIEAEWKKIG